MTECTRLHPVKAALSIKLAGAAEVMRATVLGRV